jgi:hypothetical protein
MDTTVTPAPLRSLDDVGVPCPQCALKHLRAAFSLILRSENDDFVSAKSMWNYICIPVSQAAVALTEWVEGYTYHFDYAYGCLVSAEDIAVSMNHSDVAKDIRSARLMLDKIRNGVDKRPAAEAVVDVLSALSEWNYPIVGHLAEACREAPRVLSFSLLMMKCMIIEAVTPAQVVLSFINQLVQFIGADNHSDKVSSPETVSPLDMKKGGESTMSCSGKKCSKKLVKAACGGGKVKKACKKGGCKK